MLFVLIGLQTAKDSDDDESLPALRFEASRLRSELEETRSEAKAAEDRAGEAEEELEELETRSGWDFRTESCALFVDATLLPQTMLVAIVL